MISIPVDILITEKYYVKLLISIEFSDRFLIYRELWIWVLNVFSNPLFHLKKNSYPVSIGIWLFVGTTFKCCVFTPFNIHVLLYKCRKFNMLSCFVIFYCAILRKLHYVTVIQQLLKISFEKKNYWINLTSLIKIFIF